MDGLDMTTGQAAIAYVGEIPWHGLGVKIAPDAPFDERIRCAGLNWKVDIIPSQYEFNGKMYVAPNSFHMIRTDNAASLSVMSKRYKPVQPVEIMAFFEEFVSVDERFTFETAGSLFGGAKIWALYRFTADSFLVAGDPHVCYVLLTTSFDGSLATTAQATMIRVVCNNTLTASIYAGKKSCVKVSHSVDFSKASVKKDCLKRLELVVASFDQYKALGEALAGIRMSGEQIEELFARMTTEKMTPEGKEPSTKAKNQLEGMFRAYRQTVEEGTPASTGWSVLNAVTRYVDHDRTSRNTQGDKRAASMASSFYGSGATFKRQALEIIADMANLELAA